MEGAVLKLLEEHGGDAAFAPEDVRILVAAFDAAWRSLEKSGVHLGSERRVELTRQVLATHIIEMAKRGERDQRRLREDALLHLAQSNLRSAPNTERR